MSMEMNKAKYSDLILRFAKELHEVGVTEDMKKIVEDQYTRTPNVSSAHVEEVTDSFLYRHDGYSIEAATTVELRVKKCK